MDDQVGVLVRNHGFYPRLNVTAYILSFQMEQRIKIRLRVD